MANTSPEVIYFSPRKFLGLAAAAALAIAFLGSRLPLPPWLLPLEVFITIVALFVLGSIRYQLDKNALTYGAVLIIGATFWTFWWPESGLRAAIQTNGWAELGRFAGQKLLYLHSLDELVHADTMLFILGLTFFVAVIAQTRLLETVSFAVLERNKGNVFLTIAILAAIVSFASGILDGVSMIGLMIRTLIIILFLAKANDEAVLYAVVVSTVVTTVCGMWLAYGEPPNLIMKSNLHPHLTNSFFLRYCLPVAIGAYFLVVWNIRRKLPSSRIDVTDLDVMDINTADVRYLQASYQGQVMTPIEFLGYHRETLGNHHKLVEDRLHSGEPLGLALRNEGVPESVRRQLLGQYVSEELAATLDDYYSSGDKAHREASERKIREALAHTRISRVRSQIIGTASFLPFVGFLIWHGVDHSVPLFWASFIGFGVAFLGIVRRGKMRRLALREATHEFKEYLFLLPLFFSITLLQKTGFFQQIAGLIVEGIGAFGATAMAYFQFAGATFLSAMLDNNVVADFAGRALQGLSVALIHMFAMAQIAGYAIGGCLTHIGSAQSVVAYSFIRKEIDGRFTPFQWIRSMAPLVAELFVWVLLVIFVEGWLLQIFPE